MFSIKKSETKALWLILLPALVVLFSGIGLTSIYMLDEAKNAEAAREMLVNNDFITPTFNGELRTDKPPLHYYFMAAGYSLFGTNSFGARFFSAVMGILTIVFTFLFAKKHLGKEAALMSCLVLLSSIHFLLQMQMAVPDPYLIFLLTVAFFSFFEAWQNNGRVYWWIFYTAIGLGVLAKGPVAIALPGFTALFFLLLSGTFNIQTILRLNPFTGLLLSIAIAFPWYFFVHQATNGVWTEGFFLNHNLERFSESRETHGGSFLITIAFVLLGFLPFLLFLPAAVLKAFQKRDHLLTYLLTGCGVIILFFMCSGTKLPNYTVPCYPLLAIVCGYYFTQFTQKKWQWIATSVLCFFLPVVAIIGLRQDENLKHLWPLGLFFLIPLAGCLFTFQKNEHRMMIYAGSWIFFGWMVFLFIYPAINEENPVENTKEFFTEKKQVVAYKQFNPAYIFKLKKEIPVLENATELSEFIRSHEGIILISRKDSWDELKLFPLKKIAEIPDTFEKSTTVVAIPEKEPE